MTKLQPSRAREAVACFLLSLGIFGTLPVLALTDAQTLRNFGAELLANAPAGIRNGTPVEKAKYAMGAYCDALAKADAPVNASWWNRFQNLVRNADASRWTCGDHANNLEAVFGGMGIKQNEIMLTADSNSSIPSPNSNHGALGIEYLGTVYMFDPWQLAVNNSGSYSGAAASKWNGMTASAWEAEMLKQGYVQFSDDLKSWNDKVSKVVSRYLSRPPNDLAKLSAAQIEGYIASLKEQHRELQTLLVALPPGADTTGNAIRAEQKALYQQVMRLKKELASR